MNASSATVDRCALPQAETQQHMLALAQANRVRLARAALKRRVGAGEVHVADVILDPPSEAEGMTITDLLTSQRRWGATRCRKFLASLPLTETKTVGSMTERQRLALAAMLGGHVDEVPTLLPVAQLAAV